LDYVDWFNSRCLYETCGDIPPAELQDVYYRHNSYLAEAS
jgi:putative transposase